MIITAAVSTYLNFNTITNFIQYNIMFKVTAYSDVSIIYVIVHYNLYICTCTYGIL